MEIWQMRDYISKHPKYKDSPTWIDKCNTMPDDQVIAIYHKFKDVDYAKLDRKLNKKPRYHQINMWEYLAEQGR